MTQILGQPCGFQVLHPRRPSPDISLAPLTRLPSSSPRPRRHTWDAGRGTRARARKLLGWPKRCKLTQMHSGGNAAVKGCSWPNFWANLTPSSLRSHCRFVLPLIHFVPYSLIYSVRLFLKQQCDRTLGRGERRDPDARGSRRRHGCRR